MSRAKYSIERSVAAFLDVLNDVRDLEAENAQLKEKANQIDRYKKEITNLHKKIQRLEGANLSSPKT